MVTHTTATMELVEAGEKRDRVGRKLTQEARREELVGAWQRSGLTRASSRAGRACAVRPSRTGCSSTGAMKGAPKPAGPKVRFAEVQLPASRTRGLEARLPDGTTLRGERVEELVALLRALRA